MSYATAKKILGQKFGKLTISEISGPNNSGQAQVKCICDCGREKITAVHRITNGNCRSCGCLNRKMEPGIASRNTLLGQYKKNAKNRKYEWSISDTYAIQLFEKTCYYCDAPPSNIFKSGSSNNGSYKYNGIDRVDNSKGYTVDNSVSCCKDCNVKKGSVSLSICKKILVHEGIVCIDHKKLNFSPK